MKSPILFIVFNRPDTTRRVFEAIRMAKPPRLFVAADGPRIHKEGESAKCEQVRSLVKEVDWDCDVHYLFRDKNLGCGKGVRGAIDWFFSNVDEGIILEDDILPDPSFFSYCDELLERFRGDMRVGSICASNLWGGYTKNPHSYGFSQHASIWGWATWRNRWKLSERIYSRVEARDPLLASECQLVSRSPARCERFWKDFSRLYTGLDTWDYQWCMTVYSNHLLVVRPRVNLVANLGFGSDATHTNGPAPEHYSKSEAIELPMVHPAAVSQNLDADEILENVWLGPAYPSPVKKTVRQRIKNLLLKVLKKSGLLGAVRNLVNAPQPGNAGSQEITAHESARLEGINVIARQKARNGQPRIQIGSDSIVRAAFVFENDSGQISIGDRSFLGGGMIISTDGISIGDDVMISWGCTIVDNNAHSTVWEERARDVLDAYRGLASGTEGAYKDWSSVISAPIRIEDKVWIGFNSIILKGVTIGEGAVVAAGSVVTKNVEPFTVVGGNPAAFIKACR